MVGDTDNGFDFGCSSSLALSSPPGHRRRDQGSHNQGIRLVASWTGATRTVATRTGYIQRVYEKHRNILTTFIGRYNKHILFSNIVDILQKKNREMRLKKEVSWATFE